MMRGYEPDIRALNALIATLALAACACAIALAALYAYIVS